jgi:hypothetical protein
VRSADGRSVEDHGGAPDATTGRWLLALAGLTCAGLIAAGGLLWWRLGGAVFSDYVLSGLAWCF